MVSVLDISGAAIILMDRRFDSNNALEVEADVKRIVERSPERVLFDFSETEYIASAGMRVLLSLTRSILQKGGKVALSSLSPNVRKVFDIGGFTKVFPIFGTRQDAFQYLQE
jgi:anti-anti-sigma factor